VVDHGEAASAATGVHTVGTRGQTAVENICLYQ
jgi:hypothetical protein